jgi:hypothetical protein
MVAFPLAAAGVGFARDPTLRRLLNPSVWGPALAVAVLGAWFLFFGGYGPVTAVEWQAIRTVQPSIVLPQNSLYLLACIGAFYVLPEMALLRRPLRHALTPGHAAVVAAGLGLVFALFPPLNNDGPIPTMGFLDQAARLALSDPLRVLVFYVLALLAVLRFSAFSLESASVLIYALLMAKAHLAWDKYALPVLLVVWCIAAASELPAATVMPSAPPHEPGRTTPPLRRQKRPRTFGAFQWPD